MSAGACVAKKNFDFVPDSHFFLISSLTAQRTPGYHLSKAEHRRRRYRRFLIIRRLVPAASGGWFVNCMSDVTQILEAIDQGDPQAAEQLLPLVYGELRRFAAHKLAQEPPGQTLDATALVHEAYLKLVGGPETRRWESHRHFFAAAAEAIRRILVDRARHKRSQKAGGELVRRDLEESEFAAPEVTDDLLAVDEALNGLAAVDPQAAELVKLRYFAGLSIPEAAQALGISPRSADRVWVYARAWLHEALHGDK
jgi:RNA polymerase sigma factor (TIGR02999 family)